MTDELKLRREADRGMKAEALIKNPLLVEAFALLETEYYEAWKKSMPSDVAGRERLHSAAVIIGKVRSHLEQVVRDGEVAEAHLKQIAATPSAYRR